MLRCFYIHILDMLYVKQVHDTDLSTTNKHQVVLRPHESTIVCLHRVYYKQLAGLAQLGERQTEVKLQSLNLKVMCSIHISRKASIFGSVRLHW